MTIFLLFSWALYYISTIIIDDDLIKVFYTLEKMYMHRAYIVHFTAINLLAIQ